MAHLYIGSAGWQLPKAYQHQFPVDGTHLQRYAGRFNAVEVNSTFHRLPRPATAERWAASVPEEFRFSLKLPMVEKDRLLATIEATIRHHDILRLKGFAAIPGSPMRLAIQAVGPRLSAYFDRPWGPGEPRETALVVIGESPLARDAITRSLGAAAG